MTEAESLAAFACQTTFEQVSATARAALKVRILDALGCAIGAVSGEPVRILRRRIDEFGAQGRVTLIGGNHTTPDWATFYNAALVRYLDFNDSYLAPRETCHPSDNIAPVLAATEYVGGHGRDLLTALALAYQVQCRLSDVAPVRAKGFDHTIQLGYAVAAGVARALGLTPKQTANAIALAGTELNALRVTRTGDLSHWKGLAAPYTAFSAMQLALLAQAGITGPLAVFEGNKGFKETISGPFEIDWSREDLERVTKTIVKRYNAEIHSQSTLSAVLDLRTSGRFGTGDIKRVEIETFDVAYNIIGGGEEGDKRHVATKEEADHSLPYLVAVALLDGAVGPAQYEPERIGRADVQALLRRVVIRPRDEFSRRFPDRMMSSVTIHLADSSVKTKVVEDYPGFTSRPATWEDAVKKFNALAAPCASVGLRREIVNTVQNLEAHPIAELTRLLMQVSVEHEALRLR